MAELPLHRLSLPVLARLTVGAAACAASLAVADLTRHSVADSPPLAPVHVTAVL